MVRAHYNDSHVGFPSAHQEVNTDESMSMRCPWPVGVGAARGRKWSAGWHGFHDEGSDSGVEVRGNAPDGDFGLDTGIVHGLVAVRRARHVVTCLAVAEG